MDPISQACLGASLSQSFGKDKSSQTTALITGALAGMAADLDIFIRSDSDPLLFLEYHRQFTHSLIFIPVGALICSLFFSMLIKLIPTKSKPLNSEISFSKIYIFCLLGYGTHGLLDACTSYGTQLYWPFSDTRVAWNTISIIDPLFTLPLAMFVIIAAFKKNYRIAQTGFAYAIVFLSLGVVQNYRAEQATLALALQRDHLPERVLVKPSFANRHLWKTIYEFNDRYYVDGIKLLWNTETIAGTSIQKLNVAREFPWLPENSQQAKDIERFRWFSDNFIAADEQDPDTIIDMRYSILPNQIDSMWRIELNKQDIIEGKFHSHIKYKVQRNIDENIRKKFWEMLF